MPLIPAKCTQCGGVMSLDEEKDAAICPYCGNAFIVQQAIQNFSTTYVVNNNIQADTVIMGGADKEFDISAGTLKSYKGESVDVVIPDNVLRIEDRAFEKLTIHSVTFGQNVETVGKCAFFCCKELREVNFNQNLKTIGVSAFANCISLSSVKIPDNTELKETVFMGVDNLVLYLSDYTVSVSVRNGSLFEKPDIPRSVNGTIYVDNNRVFSDYDRDKIGLFSGCRIPHRTRKYEGDDIDLLLQEACSYWNCDLDDISYVILQEPKDTMLVHKPAIIKAKYIGL